MTKNQAIRLVIDLDKQHKKLFIEVAKIANARVRMEKEYVPEEEDKALLKAVE